LLRVGKCENLLLLYHVDYRIKGWRLLSTGNTAYLWYLRQH